VRGPVKLSRPGTAVFLAAAVLLFLASRFLGGVYISLFRFWWLVFLLDGLLLFFNGLGIRYYQDFDRNHVSKGESLTYTLHIESGFRLPVPALSVEFREVHTREGQLTLPAGNLSLAPRETRSSRSVIHVRLRGVYTVGLSRLTVRSYSGLISADFPIWSRTFYVYPRLIRLPGGALKLAGSDTDGRMTALRSGTPDIFYGLREYRPGDSLRYISWKRFRQTGSLYLREFSSMGHARIHLILDRRRIARSVLCEDTVLESFISVADAVLRSGDAAVLHGLPEKYSPDLTSPEDLQVLVRKSLMLNFDSVVPVVPEIQSSSGVFLFTALTDFTFLNREFWQARRNWYLICILEGLTESDLSARLNLLQEIRDCGVTVVEVRSGETIREDLACLCSH